jgi:hypothetical protein
MGDFQHQVLRCGLHGYTISSEQVPPQVLADLLERDCPLFLVLDPHRAGIDLPEDQPRNELFDFLPAESRAAVSPVLVEADRAPDWPELAEAAWGQDALICLFTKVPHESLLETLRQACRPKRGGGVEGICWPTILGALLVASDAEHLPEFLAETQALLIESPDGPESMLLVSHKELNAYLKRFGLEEVIPEPTETAEMEKSE